MASLPTGTVTFLFTDIEGSTRLWEAHPEAMRLALARHHALIATEIERCGGIVVKSQGEGDSLFAVFSRATDAAAAACALQRALLAEPWAEEAPLRVRVALHTGEAELRDGDYYGTAVNRSARLRSAAHGGQVLLSLATEELVRDHLPDNVGLRDLGEHRLRDLARPDRIFQLLHPGLRSDFPPLTTLDALPNNLPAQLTSFIGREKEMAEVKRLLGTTRLLTLTGTGGTGKTRLTLQVAADLLPEYPDGVWLVELAPLSDPSLVPQTVASALGVREEPGKPLTVTLLEVLRPKKLLIVLDNCEHLLTDCAALADTLLRQCPAVTLLASSREGLNIGGETTYRLPPLSSPDLRDLQPTLERLTGYEAVRLFIERATAAVPSFAFTNANAPAVAQVCSRLDGIPLAIELAAARVKALSVEKIAERLDDRFRLLTGGTRTALPRQQTLRALIDWSYDLLSPPEQALLRRLSVFAGGWTLEAAEAVCTGDEIEEAEVLDLLTSLVDKSLILYEEREGEGRYRLLETVRQYARDRLLESGEAEDVRDRHVEFFRRLAEEAGPLLRGADSVAWLERLETEHDNLRAALGWSGAQGHAEANLRLCEALGGFWLARGYWSEAREHLAGLLALPGTQARTAGRTRALQLAGWLAWRQGDLGAARALYDESLAICRELGDKIGTAGSLNYLGFMAREAGDYVAARARFAEGLAIFQELGEKGGTWWSLLGLGQTARDEGEYETARTLLERSLAINRELGSKWGRTWTLISLGEVAHNERNYGEARALLEESLAISRELGEKRFSAMSLNRLGFVAREEGDLEVARALIEESLAIFRELGHRFGIAQNLEGLAVVAVAQAHSERGVRLFGAAEALREAIGAPLPPAERAGHDRSVAAVRTALGEEAFAAAWAEGRALSLDEAVSYALEPAGTEPPRE